MKTKKNILIIGSGAFGTALGQILINNDHNVYVYSNNMEIINSLMNNKHPLFPNKKIDAPKKCFSNYCDAFKINYDYILLCTPSTALYDVYDQIKPYLNKNMIVINSSKGLNIKSQSNNFSDLFLKDNLIKNYALIAGPSFADEIINKDKTIVNIVCNDLNICNEIKMLFNNYYFKMIPYQNEDIVTLSCSLKNVLAIGFGIISEINQSQNTQSAFLTMGIHEIQKIINWSFQNSNSDLINYFGIGDIFLTCNSTLSRNFCFGQSIYKNGLKQTLENSKNKTVEGYNTLKNMYEKYILNLNLPFFNILYQVCFNNLDPKLFLDLIWEKSN